ncbi:ribonuclease G [Methylovorus sp. MM2]|uniref:Rne/Rng family ribonuclease n=1 Tax=Methylovorus sp. MM2 TaxID=1848038 RepID=UPI0007E11AD7|nr:Rne/Rng family ribonuclease [Methylovorus sp. MM2]OAM53067.1 ribonuclease G [Methylovorus sp. MM2]
MKRMLFNATQSEELRVAIVDGQKLIDLDIESAGKEQRKSNIYKGIITRIEPSLEAAFVNYGTDRHGFLPFKEVARSYFQGDVDAGRARIQDVLKEGQELIVQVDKDERGNKGAALTTFISLAGRYLVLMPNNPRGGGVSRRIEGEDRNELRDIMAQLEVPNGMSIIARTAGIGRTLEELLWDMNYLLQLWTAIEGASTMQSGPFLIYQEGSLVIRAIRDYFQPDIGEILIDTPDIYEQAVQFMNHVMPGNVSRVKLYHDEIPLFSRFQIEHQIETAFSREVRLPSGGAIVIDHTEALVSVDVNSGRSTKGSDIEHTAFNTNLEAAEEVARQLRLRDLGGLVVIDFIDMENQRNQREVENRLRDALHYDRARVQTGKISRFGLLELSRQRLRPSLGESNHIPCPRCHGTGHIRGIESTALHILRITQEEAMKENSAIIQVQLPVEAATFLLNEKRAEIHKIEQRMGVQVVLIPNIHLETPNYNIARIRSDDVSEDTTRASYEMVELPSESEDAAGTKQEVKAVRVEAAVKGITPASPAPISVVTPEKKASLFNRIKTWFGSINPEKEEAAPESNRPREGNRNNNRNRNRNRNGRDRNERSGNNERNVNAAERNDGERNTNQNRNNNEQRNNRPQEPRAQQNTQPRQERAPDREKPQQNPNQQNANNVEATGEQPQRSGRRGRNGRRDRNRSNEPREGQAVAGENNLQQAQPFVENSIEAPKAEIVKSVAADVVIEHAQTASEKPNAVEPQKKPRHTEPKAEKAEIAKPAVAKSELVQVETAAQPAVANETATATAEKSEKKPRAPRRRKPEAQAKPVDLAASGLQLVETKAESAKSTGAPEPVAPKAQNKPAAWQQKKSAENTKAEPLVMVETQK